MGKLKLFCRNDGRLIPIYDEGLTVKRHNKTEKKEENILGPNALREYMKQFNAVDKDDHNISLYLISISTKHYYLRIFC